jgi:hypothetical protein
MIVRNTYLIGTYGAPCVDCGIDHEDSGYVDFCAYGTPGCMESADCGSSVISHTVCV